MYKYLENELEIEGVHCRIAYYPTKEMKRFNAAEERLLREVIGSPNIDNLKYMEKIKTTSRKEILNYGPNELGIVAYEFLETTSLPYHYQSYKKGYIITAHSPTGRKTVHVADVIQLAVAPPTKTKKAPIYKIEGENKICFIQEIIFSKPCIYQSFLLLINAHPQK